MTETKLHCHIVRDLLPNYLEKLTTPETAAELEAHLADCADRRALAADLRAEIALAPPAAPRKQLAFLRKVKRGRLLGAALTVLVTLLLCYGLYGLEYRWQNDKHSINAAVQDYYAGFDASWMRDYDPYVLEIRTVGRELFAYYKSQSDPQEYGVMVLRRGFDGRYRIQEHYSYQMAGGDAPLVLYHARSDLYLIGGYQLTDAAYLGVGLTRAEREEAGDTFASCTDEVVLLPVEHEQFLYVLTEAELLAYGGLEAADGYSLTPYYTKYRLYDAQRNDITIESREGGWGRGSAGSGPWGWYLIVLILGVIITRYFLT